MKVNGKGIAIIIALFISILGYLGITLYPNVTSTITCVADAFVYQNMPNLNTGSSPYTEIQSSITWQDSTPTDLRYIYLMFDLSSIPSYAVVTDVRLNVYVSFVSTLNRDPKYGYVQSEKGQFYGITWAETNWAENTITWNNQPSNGLPGFWHSHLFGGKYGFQSGWFTWQVGGTKERLMNHLKTDKKMAYVIAPDPMNRQYYCDTSFINIYSKEKGGGFEPKLYVDYTIPSFTLTVSVKDSDGLPVQGASVTSPFTATTDASGIASASLSGGTYTVTINYKDYTYTQQVTLDSDKTVSFTIPKYTLTVKVVDAEGNPLSGATISMPVSGTTNLQGVFSTKLPKGKYTVKANVGIKEATDSVDLTSDKTVTLTLAVEFTLQIVVKDQCGNPLPAAISVDGQYAKCDSKGTALLAAPSGTRTIYASIQVGSKTFSANETFTLSKSMTKEIIITRRFYWVFYFNYTDGTVPSKGQITLTSPKETLTVPLVNGVGEAYLLDGTYRITVEASPAVEIGTVTVSQDGEVWATLNKEKASLETSTTNEVPTTSEKTPVTTPPTPEIPWVLIPSIYIYTLVGVLALGFIIAGVVALRREK